MLSSILNSHLSGDEKKEKKEDKPVTTPLMSVQMPAMPLMSAVTNLTQIASGPKPLL